MSELKKTLIINGSPHGKKGNSEIFINKFLDGTETHCEVRYALKETPDKLVKNFSEYDTLLFFMPLYVHAMPGIVMEIIEEMKPVEGANQKIGFVVQSGFVEAAQSDYLKPYFEQLAKRLNYTYLGTVVRGGAAGVCMMPEKANEKLFTMLRKLGSGFEATGMFDAEIVKELETPYRLTEKESKRYERLYRLKIGNGMWYFMLLKNKAFRKRRAKPYAK